MRTRGEIGRRAAPRRAPDSVARGSHAFPNGKILRPKVATAIARSLNPPASVVQEAPQLARPARMLELAQCLGLDLTDALARHRELLTDLFQRVVGVHADTEAHAQHAFLARRQ